MHLLDFDHLINQYLWLHDTRACFKHSNTSILEQMILQLTAGYDTDSAANILSNDPIWQLLLEKENLASPLTISRFLDRFGEKNIEELGDNEWDKKEGHYFSVQCQAKSWCHERRVCIQSVREADELLFQQTFIVTNLDESISPETIFELYNKRGTMENYIKEAKNGFFFDKIDSPTFIENYTRMMISVIAYNLVNCLKNIAFDSKQTGMTIQTIRLKFFQVAGKLVKTSKKFI